MSSNKSAALRSLARAALLGQCGPLSAQCHFFSRAFDTQRINRDPKHLTDVAAEALAPAGFADVERRRIVGQAENGGPMADAMVILLLNTGLRVDEPSRSLAARPRPSALGMV